MIVKPHELRPLQRHPPPRPPGIQGDVAGPDAWNNQEVSRKCSHLAVRDYWPLVQRPTGRRLDEHFDMEPERLRGLFVPTVLRCEKLCTPPPQPRLSTRAWAYHIRGLHIVRRMECMSGTEQDGRDPLLSIEDSVIIIPCWLFAACHQNRGDFFASS